MRTAGCGRRRCRRSVAPHQHLVGALASEMIRLDRLTPQLKLKMHYILERRESTWHDRIRWGWKDTRARGLFAYAYRAVADLAEAAGWEAEYARDVWRMHRLGYEGDRTLRFAATSHTVGAAGHALQRCGSTGIDNCPVRQRCPSPPSTG